MSRFPLNPGKSFPTAHAYTRQASGALLVSGPFLESWIDQNCGLIDFLARGTALTPLVLLPHDIHLENYGPRYEVIYGHAALTAFRTRAHASRGVDRQEPRLVCVDLSPDVRYAPCEMVEAMQVILPHGFPDGSPLAVFTTAPTQFEVGLFDAHLRLQG